jgi:hypothetical protein
MNVKHKGDSCMNIKHKGDSGYSHHIIDDSSNFDNHSKASQ